MTTALEEQHAALVSALAKPGQMIASEITANQMHCLHMAVGIAGEAGELLDAIKKWTIYQKPMDDRLLNNIIEELGDLEFYMQGLRQGLQLNREQTLVENAAKLSKRYSTGTYSDQAAQTRADKPAGQ
jgi:NTP pyrophosphatase (non-canonical NTP hydrolase)